MTPDDVGADLPKGAGNWRNVHPDEVHPPGQSFRFDVGTGAQQVWVNSPTPQDDLFPVTFFVDHAAATKREGRCSLDEMKRLALTTTAPTKAQLPWWKLATFGDIRTAAGSYRHNANIVSISGVEADYDAEQMSFDEAVAIAKAAAVKAVLYTSPSHTEGTPRWRVVCPTSSELPSDQRDRLMARLNGVYGGIFAGESWTLSQSYYYGRVNGNEAHRAEIIDGTPIDLLVGLDAGAIGKPGRTNGHINGQAADTARPAASAAPPGDQMDRRYGGYVEALLANVRAAADGEKHHVLLRAARALGGILAAAGLTENDAHEMLVAALPATVKDWKLAARTAMDGLRNGQAAPFDLEDRPGHQLNEQWPWPWHSSAASDRPENEVPPAAQDWPVPDVALASEETTPPPDLPLHDVFPPRVAEWIEAAAESKGTPPDYVAMAVLSGMGALIGNSRWAQPWEGWVEPPNLDVADVGNPSSGKSPALDTVVNELSEIEAADNEDWKERKRKYATDKAIAEERQSRWKADVKEAVKSGHTPPSMPADAETPDPPQRRRIFSTDPTVAKAERMSAANPRGLILMRDELSGWLAGMDRFNSGAGSDRAFWLQAYGGRPWSPDRVKDGDQEISVPHLTWSIIGGIQPDRLASLVLAGDDDGLAARFLYAWPAPQRPRRPRAGLTVPRVREWLVRLRTLPWTPPGPVLVPFSTAAQAVLQQWREEAAGMEEGASGLFLSWLGKLPGFAVRLALIFAHMAWCEHGRGDPPDEVTEADMLRAVTFLADYAVPMARRCFGEAALPEVERDARRLARWLLRRKPIPETLNVRALRRMQDGPGIATPDRLKAALEELAGLGWARPAPSRNGAPGRMRADWAVNPLLAGASRGVG